MKKTRKPGAPNRNVNALRHGLFAKSDLIEGESPAEYQQYVQAILADEEPKGPMERIIVQRIAGLCWRIERIPRLEAAAFDHLTDTLGRTESVVQVLERLALY